MSDDKVFNQFRTLSRRFEVSATVRNGEIYSVRGNSLRIKPSRIIASFNFDNLTGNWGFIRVAITGMIITEPRTATSPTTARSWSRKTLDDAPEWVRAFVTDNYPEKVL